MINNKNSIIIGKGIGISKFLSLKLGIKSIHLRDLYKFDLSEFSNIIYTSTDPSFNLPRENVSNYLEKNIKGIFKVLESNFQGNIIYLSSTEAGAYDVNRKNSPENFEQMYTPYSFSKYCAESLLMNHKLFKSCAVIRIGLIWPTKENSNFNKALTGSIENISLDLKSSYFITPYSLLLKFVEKQIKQTNKKYFIGYLTSSNRISLQELCQMRAKEYKNHNQQKYLYLAKEKEKGILDLTEGRWFNWKNEFDYNNIISMALEMHGEENLLPN